MILHISRMRRNVNRNVYNAGKSKRYNVSLSCRRRTREFNEHLPEEVVRLEAVVVPHSHLERLRHELGARDVHEDERLVPLGVERPSDVLRASLLLRAATRHDTTRSPGDRSTKSKTKSS